MNSIFVQSKQIYLIRILFTKKIDVNEMGNPIEMTDADGLDIEKRLGEYFEMKCELCAYQLNSLDDVQEHFKNVHNINRGFLKCCNKKFFMRRGIIEHIGWHVNPNVFRYG